MDWFADLNMKVQIISDYWRRYLLAHWLKQKDLNIIIFNQQAETHS